MLEQDDGPMRQQVAARSIQRLYRRRMKETRKRQRKEAELRASRVVLGLSKQASLSGKHNVRLRPTGTSPCPYPLPLPLPCPYPLPLPLP